MNATRVTRRRERGAALMVTLIIIASLLAGAAVVVGMQLDGNRGTDLTRSGMTAIYCAEEGLERAAPIVAQNYPLWNANLCTAGSESSCVPPTTPEASLFATINHNINGGSGSDFVLYLRDDDDEPGNKLAQNYGSDANLKVYIVSTCTMFPDTPKQVKELVNYTGGGNCYNSQAGGCLGNGNAN